MMTCMDCHKSHISQEAWLARTQQPGTAALPLDEQQCVEGSRFHRPDLLHCFLRPPLQRDHSLSQPGLNLLQHHSGYPHPR